MLSILCDGKEKNDLYETASTPIRSSLSLPSQVCPNRVIWEIREIWRPVPSS